MTASQYIKNDAHKKELQKKIDDLLVIKELIENFRTEGFITLRNAYTEVNLLLNSLEVENAFGFNCSECRFQNYDIEKIKYFDSNENYFSEDGSSSKEEYLYLLRFSQQEEFLIGLNDCNNTKDYAGLYKDFFNELRTYNPAYVNFEYDYLLFRADNAKAMYDALPTIVKKYRALTEVEIKKNRKKYLLAKLKDIEEDIKKNEINLGL